MKRLWLFTLLACCKPADTSIPLPPAVVVNAADTSLHNVNGCWMRKGAKYNGHIVETDSGVQTGKVPVIDGKENGVAYGWYKSGKKKYERHFVNGNREGVHKGWYENDTLAFLYYFRNDKYEGGQKTWFQSGHPWQSLNYVKGYEEGKQRLWNDSGRVINNFTVKNGKLYGVIGRFDCMSVYKK